MRIKHKRNLIIEKLFNDYAFRMMYDDPKKNKIKKIYMSRDTFKNNGDSIVEIYFFDRKSIKIVLKNVDRLI